MAYHAGGGPETPSPPATPPRTRWERGVPGDLRRRTTVGADMRALRSFTVRARLPEALAPLHELAMNLRWSWDERTRDLFRWLDPATRGIPGHDRIRLLSMVGRDRLNTLTQDRAFMGFLREVH